MLASEVMDGSAALLNDSSKELFSYAVQLPYLKIALEQIVLELSALDIDTVKEESPVLTLLAGTTEITPTSVPPLPLDLRTPKKLEERASGSNLFYPMVLGTLPDIELSSTLGYWDFRENEIKLLGANADVDVKIYYDKDLGVISSELSLIVDDRLKNPLSYYTAALCARYIGENYQRYNDLLREFQAPMNNYIALTVGQNQATPVRRRGFRERNY